MSVDAGPALSRRPTRPAVALLGNPDKGAAAGAALIDVIALLMRRGWEHHDILRVLDKMDDEIALPDGAEHDATAIHWWLMADDTAVRVRRE